MVEVKEEQMRSAASIDDGTHGSKKDGTHETHVATRMTSAEGRHLTRVVAAGAS